MTDEPPSKPVIWVGSSLKDLRRFPSQFRIIWAMPCTLASAAAGETPGRDMELIEQRLREAEQIAKGRGHE